MPRCFVPGDEEPGFGPKPSLTPKRSTISTNSRLCGRKLTVCLLLCDGSMFIEKVADFLRFGLEPLQVARVEIVRGGHIRHDVIGEQVDSEFLDPALAQADIGVGAA